MESKSKIYIGIDNGVTGSIGVINGHWASLQKTPVLNHREYTKKKGFLNRLNHEVFRGNLQKIISANPDAEILVMLERPFTGKAYKVVKSAMRCLEAQLVILEQLGLKYVYCSSGDWQKPYLGDIKTSKELKKVSLKMGRLFYPEVHVKIEDFDGLWIAQLLKDQTEDTYTDSLKKILELRKQ